MDNEPDTNDGAANTNQNPLPLGESVPTAPLVELIKPIVPNSIAKQNISASPPDDAGHNDVKKPREPLQIRIVKDDEPSSFEKKTVRFGKAGIIVAGLSLIAACVAAFFIFQQFKEMADQTDLSSRVAKQVRIDAKDSGIATAKQLTTLQSQINIARNATKAAQDSLALARQNFILDQRPYVLVSSARLEFDDGTGKTSTIRSDKKIAWRLNYLNYGKSPATDFAGMEKAFFGKDAQASAYAYIERLPKSVDGIPGGSRSIVAPNMNLDHPGYTTVFSDAIPTPDDITFISTHEFTLFIAGRLFYKDLRGNRYYTDFCKFRFLSGGIADCHDHNEPH